MPRAFGILVIWTEATCGRAIALKACATVSTLTPYAAIEPSATNAAQAGISSEMKRAFRPVDTALTTGAWTRIPYSGEIQPSSSAIERANGESALFRTNGARDMLSASERLADSRFRELDATHFIPFGQPELVLAELKNVLKRVGEE